MRVVDTHLHLWDPAILDYAWLEGDLAARFGPDELRAATADTADDLSFVFVQADCAPEQGLAEARWVAALADELDIRGIVAYAPLERGARVAEWLDALGAEPLVVGVRRLLQGAPAGFARTPAFVAGARELAARSLVFDACVRADGIADVAALADAVPELVIVLDHLGKPPVGGAAAPRLPHETPWLADIRALAERPGVRAKISGLPAESQGAWDAAHLAPFLDAALEAFGADRLVFGSDWPVSERADPARWRDAVAAWATDRLSPEGADAVMCGTAQTLYSTGRSRSADMPPSTSM